MRRKIDEYVGNLPRKEQAMQILEEEDQRSLAQQKRSKRLERLRFSRDYLDAFVGGSTSSKKLSLPQISGRQSLPSQNWQRG